MKRRGFLAGLASAAGAFALDPERALWVPGARLISIPRLRPVLVAYRHSPDHSCDQFMAFDGRTCISHFVSRMGYPLPPSGQLPHAVRVELAHRLAVDPARLVLG